MAHALVGRPDAWPSMPSGLTTANTAWGTAYFMPGTDATTGETALVPSVASGGPADGVTGAPGGKKHHHRPKH
jgi:hypothetical protein